MMASIDVVIPSYNYVHFLPGCVQSILDQDLPTIRVLIIDNASTDGSAEIAAEIARRDDRVEVLARRKNLGPHASFNAGIEWARSDYLLILCADDLLVQGALRRAVTTLDARPDMHLAYGKTYFTSGESPDPGALNMEGEPQWHFSTGHQLIERFCHSGRNHVSGPTAVVRTAVQKAVGYYRAHLRHTDDLEMWMRFALFGGAVETDAWQAISRVHAHNQSATVANTHDWNVEFEAAFRSFFAHEGADLPDARRLERMALSRLGARAYCSGLAHLARGEPGAMQLLRYALKARWPFGILPPVGYLVERFRGRSPLQSTL